ECALLHRTSRSYTLSERLVHGDARRLRASADAVRPLERHERSERPARFDARADARIETRIRSPAGIVHARPISKTIHAQSSPRPGRGAAKHRSPVVSTRCCRLPLEPVLEDVGPEAC